MQRYYKMRINLFGGHAFSKNSAKVAESQKSRSGKLLNRHSFSWILGFVRAFHGEKANIFIEKGTKKRTAGIRNCLSSTDTDWKTSRA
jgi:hypothetical protein